MDSLDLLAVQGTLKSLLQHYSSKASILRLSPFFIVQLTHPYMTTGKTIALTRWTFVGKVMSLLFNMLSRLVITFLPRSKHLLISWRQSPPAVILEPPPKKKSATVSTVSHMQSTSCEMTGWMKHKLESRLPEEISITSSIADDTTLMVESKEELKSLFDEGERGKEKNLAFKNATFKNQRSWLPFPSLHGK